MRSHLEPTGVRGIAPSPLWAGGFPPAPKSPAPLLLSSPFETDAAPEGQRRGVLLETDQTAEQTRERERKTRYRQKKREKKIREMCRNRATMGCVGNQLECSGGVQSVKGCDGL